MQRLGSCSAPVKVLLEVLFAMNSVHSSEVEKKISIFFSDSTKHVTIIGLTLKKRLNMAESVCPRVSLQTLILKKGFNLIKSVCP